MISLTFYILLCICNVVISSTSIDIKTTLGRVRGKLVDDKTTGAFYYAFEGIPYAEAPVGALRFMPPVPKRAWTNVFDATKPGCVCPQSEIMYSKKEMSEDCLNFNVYTPANYPNKLRPVMFIIHGGDFEYSSGNAQPVYGPELFILNDIIVVSINYRLGALGFLSLCNEEVSGNAGVKDVILVLKTVHENIEKFGGDPNKITIIGFGAGAAMTELLMLTKQTAGLFQNVVLHGGSILSSKYFQLNPRKYASLLGREIGSDISSADAMLKKLRNANAFDIVKAQEAIARQSPQRGVRQDGPFKPTIEIECGSAVLTRLPLDMIKKGEMRDLPIMIGFNDQQGIELFPLLREEPQLINRLNENFERFVPSDIQYPCGSKARRNLADRIRDFYFNGANISLVTVQNYVNLMSDSEYTYSIDYFVKLFKERYCSPVYYYIFTADTELNWFKADVNITYPGAGPFDNLGYIFLTTVTEPRYKCLETTTKHIQDSILLSLKYFMYYGSPVPTPNNNCWPEAGKDRYHIVRNYETIAVYRRPLPKRIDFWSRIYEEYFRSSWYTGCYGCMSVDGPKLI